MRTTDKPSATDNTEENLNEDEEADEELTANDSREKSNTLNKDSSKDPHANLVQVLPEERIFRVENVYVI